MHDLDVHVKVGGAHGDPRRSFELDLLDDSLDAAPLPAAPLRIAPPRAPLADDPF